MANNQDKKTMAKEEVLDWLKNNLIEGLALFIKGAVWVWWVLLSVVAKLSFVFYRGEKLTTIKVVSTIGMSLFVGYISFKLCMRYVPDKASVLVPVCTLGSEKIIAVLLTLDYKSIIMTFFKLNKKDN